VISGPIKTRSSDRVIQTRLHGLEAKQVNGKETRERPGRIVVRKCLYLAQELALCQLDQLRVRFHPWLVGFHLIPFVSGLFFQLIFAGISENK